MVVQMLQAFLHGHQRGLQGQVGIQNNRKAHFGQLFLWQQRRFATHHQVAHVHARHFARDGRQLFNVERGFDEQKVGPRLLVGTGAVHGSFKPLHGSGIGSGQDHHMVVFAGVHSGLDFLHHL